MNTLLLQQCLNQCFGSKLNPDGILGNQTLTALNNANARIKKKMEVYGERLYSGFVAIRTKKVFDNRATDYLLYLENESIKEVMTCSTRAGDFYVFNPITYGGITGTAVLAEGFYKNTWLASIQIRFGFRSVELLQMNSVKIWRDGNKNRVLDKTVTQTGTEFGINIHTAGWNNIIDRWSAGCLVVPKGYWDSFTSKYIKIGTFYSLMLMEI